MSLSIGIINKAIEESEKSNYHIKMGCVIFKGNRIISYAHNGLRYCSGIHTRFRKWENSLHAEQAAALKAGNWNNLKGCSILVLKVSKTEKLLSNAKPCKFCEATLRMLGIKNVYYSNSKGEIVYENYRQE